MRAKTEGSTACGDTATDPEYSSVEEAASLPPWASGSSSQALRVSAYFGASGTRELGHPTSPHAGTHHARGLDTTASSSRAALLQALRLPVVASRQLSESAPVLTRTRSPRATASGTVTGRVPVTRTGRRATPVAPGSTSATGSESTGKPPRTSTRPMATQLRHSAQADSEAHGNSEPEVVDNELRFSKLFRK